MSKRFAYPLEPVLVQRGWVLNELRVELAAITGRCAERRSEIQALSLEIDGVQQAWRLRTDANQPLQLHMLSAFSAYIGKLQVRRGQAEKQLSELEAERTSQLGLVLQATRALEALVDHKAEEHRVFNSEQEKVNMTEADDRWLVLKGREDHAREI